MPSFGAFAFWDDFLVKKNHMTLHYEFWPSDFIAGKFKDRYQIDDTKEVFVSVGGLTRPDLVFYGIGPNSLDEHRSRYQLAGFDVRVGADARPWRSSRVELDGGVKKADISDGHWQSDPSLTAEAATGAFAVPFGFNRGYIAPYLRAYAALDPHPRDLATGSGARVAVDLESGADAQHGFSGWMRYGATLKGYVDLNDRGRILSLTVGALFCDPMGPDPVPFTELVSLGGDKWMHGYFEGRLVGRSALVASLEYEWPIGPSFNAVLEGAIGNVFGAHLEDFDVGLLRLSWSLGLGFGKDPPVRIVIGFGTETFTHGTQVELGPRSARRAPEFLRGEMKPENRSPPRRPARRRVRSPRGALFARHAALAGHGPRPGLGRLPPRADGQRPEPRELRAGPLCVAALLGRRRQPALSAALRAAGRSRGARGRRTSTALDEVADSAWFTNRIGAPPDRAGAVVAGAPCTRRSFSSTRTHARDGSLGHRQGQAEGDLARIPGRRSRARASTS